MAIETAQSTATTPKPAPARQNTATPASPPKLTVTPSMPADALRTSTPRPQAAEAEAPKPADGATPKEQEVGGFLGFLKGWLFGNTENKLFMIKLNALHFKEFFANLLITLKNTPVKGVIAAIEGAKSRVGRLLDGMKARMAATGGAAEEAGLLSRAIRPLGKVLGGAVKIFEKGSLVFGAMVAVQDWLKAGRSFADAKASGLKRGLLTGTAALSTIGLVASAAALWGPALAAAAAIGLTPALLGGIAMACFGGSLLTGWLAKKQDPPAETIEV